MVFRVLFAALSSSAFTSGFVNCGVVERVLCFMCR